MKELVEEIRNRLGLYEINDKMKIDEFHCENEEVNTFFCESALEFNKNNISRVYVAINKDTKDIVGFITLSAFLLRLGAKAKYGISRVPSILLGRLAVSNNYRNQKLGEFLVELALGICDEVQKLIGCRLLVAEAPEGSKIINYFEKSNFQFERKTKRFGKTFMLYSCDL